MSKATHRPVAAVDRSRNAADVDIGEQHAREGRELNYLDPESNEAHAAGQVCERCGTVITASQDVRLLPDGHWMHEVCPVITKTSSAS